jgi:hypothetical protein
VRLLWQKNIIKVDFVIQVSNCQNFNFPTLNQQSRSKVSWDRKLEKLTKLSFLKNVQWKCQCQSTNQICKQFVFYWFKVSFFIPVVLVLYSQSHWRCRRLTLGQYDCLNNWMNLCDHIESESPVLFTEWERRKN